MSTHAKVYLHPVIERVWHWVHAVCILGLIVTGVGIHWPNSLSIIGGLDISVTLHNLIGWVTIADLALWLAYNLILGRLHHYIPTRKDLWPGTFVQAKFYGMDCFLGAEHPYHPQPSNKFNPLQKLSYLGVMAVIMPLLCFTGLLYLYPIEFAGVIGALGGLSMIAIVHFILGGVCTAFLIAHVYLCTMGSTVTEDFTHMFTGYGEDHGSHH
jgi:thiosulfate reductase cytochrome b subunit